MHLGIQCTLASGCDKECLLLSSSVAVAILVGMADVASSSGKESHLPDDIVMQVEFR